jgi:predicted dehydrogenase
MENQLEEIRSGEEDRNRRDFLKTAATAGAAVFTTNLFTGNVKGANDRIATAFIGVGQQGRTNMRVAMARPEVEVVNVCDVYKPCLDYAVRLTQNRAKPVKDFREVLANKSIDAVCISTPDHWHAYMTVEACKAGKDVYVEKPISLTIEEGKKMVEAARKYNRVVQAGTMQRSAEHFQKAIDLISDGALGKVTEVATWNNAHLAKEGIGNPPDSPPPPDLDWNFWLGPAPERPYNVNRFGYDIANVEHPRWFSNFRWFWDYAGGMMTDWGVHLLDIVQAAFDEEQPKSISAQGGKYYLTDDRETPDTLKVTFEYASGFLASYENRNNNVKSILNKPYGILFYGENGSLFVDRTEFFVIPEQRKGQPMMPETSMKAVSQGNTHHWENFLACVRSRQRPTSDIEICYTSATTCLLGNIALRSGERIDFDTDRQTITNPVLKKWMDREVRAPWKLTV